MTNLFFALKVKGSIIISDISEVYIGFVCFETSTCVILDWVIFLEGGRLAFHPDPRARGLSSVEKRSIFCLLERKLKKKLLRKEQK